MVRTLDAALWTKRVHEDGEVICQGCDSVIDLSNADDINEGVEIWNNHVQEAHR